MHFDFTNIGTEMLSFWDISIWNRKIWFCSPCTYLQYLLFSTISTYALSRLSYVRSLVSELYNFWKHCYPKWQYWKHFVIFKPGSLLKLWSHFHGARKCCAHICSIWEVRKKRSILEFETLFTSKLVSPSVTLKRLSSLEIHVRM